MANHSSAEKRARQAKIRTARNTARLSRVRSAVRKFRQALAAGDAAQTAQALQAATRELQKAGSKGTLHRRNVARRISRLAQAQHKAQSATPA